MSPLRNKMFRYSVTIVIAIVLFFTTEFINILLLSLKREGRVQAVFATVRLCERGRRRVAKKPYDLSPKYLGFSLCKCFVVHTCMWLDITGLCFVSSQSVKYFILSRYTSNLVCIPISVFSTLVFYRPHNNFDISRSFEKAAF